MTSEEMVLGKLPFKDKCVLKKGCFPELVGNLDDTFAFVNLDMDLYKPTIEGLRYFYPRMANGDVILVRDYFTEIFLNIEVAVDDYEKELFSFATGEMQRLVHVYTVVAVDEFELGARARTVLFDFLRDPAFCHADPPFINIGNIPKGYGITNVNEKQP